MAESQRLELWKPLLASAVFKTAALPVILTLHILGCATVTLKFIVHMRYTRNISYLPIMRLTPEFLCLMYGVEPLYPYVAEGIGLEPTRRLLDYWQISNLLPYQLGLTLHMVNRVGVEPTSPKLVAIQPSAHCHQCYLFILVPGTRLELARYRYHRILSPGCLPIPPSRHMYSAKTFTD